LESYLEVNLLGPGPRLLKREFTDRCLTKVEKHCTMVSTTCFGHYMGHRQVVLQVIKVTIQCLYNNINCMLYTAADCYILVVKLMSR